MSIISTIIKQFDRIETKHVESTYIVVKHVYDYLKVSNLITGKVNVTESTSWTTTSEGKSIGKAILKLGVNHGPKLISHGIKLLKK